MMNSEKDLLEGQAPVPGKALRALFPIFDRQVRQPDLRPLSFLDSAASAQKPIAVIRRLSEFLSYEHANIHRGAYELSAAATRHYEEARSKVASFICARPNEIIFTRSATESINLVSRSLEEQFEPGDTILVTMLEHHSNIVPWQMLARRKKLKVLFSDILENASLSMLDFEAKLKESRPKLVACTMHSNSFGTVLPVTEMLSLAREVGAWTLLDGAQAVVHAPLDVAALGCDFLSFSGHKLYGPTGIGVLYAAGRALEVMEPFQGGGDMIDTVSIEGSSWAEPPQKFEAGTPAIAEAIAFTKAIELVEAIGRDNLLAHEAALFERAFEALRQEPGVTVYGPAINGGKQSSIIPFNVRGVHPHDLATIADGFNVQIRAGHHCAMPALKRLGLLSTARASLAAYSCFEDIEALLDAIRAARKMLG